MRTAFLCECLVVVLAGCPDGPGPDPDSDTITDADEGRAQGVDTDGDGLADYRDGDSDGDGIEDRVEAGDDDPATPPVDSDRDGTPDFRDLDSDGNGIADGAERTDDTDGDGIPDFRDDDDDDDGVGDVLEITLEGGDGTTGDADEDGMPGFRDLDSDGDTILDGNEWGADSDEDGLANAFDSDSDGDGLADATEAGDGDVRTPAIDTDGDRVADFRDLDSDADGLPDASEVEEGTHPRDGDSDDDGVSDLVEVGAGTDPLDASDHPRAHGDFVFLVPFEEDPVPLSDTLAFRTHVRRADLYFLFDTTASMSEEIGTVRAAVSGLVATVVCEGAGVSCGVDDDCGEGEICGTAGECIEDPLATYCIESLWTGVGTFAGGRDSYRNRLSLQEDGGLTAEAVPTSAGGSGGDESLFESVSCVADPAECADGEDTCATAGIGCPGYREDAIHMLLAITDERDGCERCAVSADEAGAALSAAGVVFLGVDAAADHAPAADLSRVARASDSLDENGDPLVYSGDSAAVLDAVARGVNKVVEDVPIPVTLSAVDEVGDDGDALGFLGRVTVNVSAAGCAALAAVQDTDGDGSPDAFLAVRPGTPVCWDLGVLANETVEPAARPLVFRATLTVRGDGSVVDERRVFFVVPPKIDLLE